MIQIKIKDWFFSLSCVGWAWITIFSCFATSANNRLTGKRISLTHFRNVMFSSQQLKYAQPCQPLTLKTDILFPVQLSGRSTQMLLLQWRYVSQCKPEISLAVTWAETLSFSLTHTCRQIADYLQDLQSKSALLKSDISVFTGCRAETQGTQWGLCHWLLCTW